MKQLSFLNITLIFDLDHGIGLGPQQHRKDLITRNTHMKYESRVTYHSQVMESFLQAK